MYSKIFIFICIIVAIYFSHIYNLDSTKEHFSQNKYNNIWMYWENKNGGKTPVLIDLCIKTVKKHCSKNFKIIILNEKNIQEYISDVPKNLNKLPIAQKTDYYRIALLYKYAPPPRRANPVINLFFFATLRANLPTFPARARFPLPPLNPLDILATL